MAQHMEALKKANRNRMMRRKIREDIRDEVVCIQDLIHDPPEVVLTGRLSYFLLSKRGWAETRTEAILKKSGCTYETKVGKLTERQRTLLIEILDSIGTPLLHDTCPRCGKQKHYTSKLCLRCSNQSRRRRPWSMINKK